MTDIVVGKALERTYNGLPGTLNSADCKVGSLLVHRQILIKGNYKFSRDGGAITTPIALKDEQGNPITLPAGLIVKDGLIVVKTGVTSGGSATYSLGIAGGAEFKSAAALTTIDVADERTLLIPLSATASTAVIVGTAGLFTITIATDTFIGGELDVFLECYYRE